jgi:DNA polymerase III epsilon subunit-like protein
MIELFDIKKRKSDYTDFSEFLKDSKTVAIEWAKKKLKDVKTVYVDIETTGFPSNDFIPDVVQISLLNYKGQALLSAMLDSPRGVIPLSASKAHNIYLKDVEDCPYFSNLAPWINQILMGKTLVAYNAAFDIRILTDQFSKCLEDWVPPFEPECLMEYYAAFTGDWKDSRQDFKWQKLPKLGLGKSHDSLVDAMSSFELVKLMSGLFVEEDLIDLDF